MMMLGYWTSQVDKRKTEALLGFISDENTRWAVDSMRRGESLPRSVAQAALLYCPDRASRSVLLVDGPALLKVGTGSCGSIAVLEVGLLRAQAVLEHAVPMPVARGRFAGQSASPAGHRDDRLLACRGANAQRAGGPNLRLAASVRAPGVRMSTAMSTASPKRAKETAQKRKRRVAIGAGVGAGVGAGLLLLYLAKNANADEGEPDPEPSDGGKRGGYAGFKTLAVGVGDVDGDRELRLR